MGCVVSRATNQSIPHDATATTAPTFTIVSWDQEYTDANDMHSNSTNPSRITVSGFSGVLTFHVSAFVVWASNSTGVRRARILKNSGGTITTVCQDVTSAANADVGPVNPSHVIDAIAGDFFYVDTTQNSGGTLGVTIASTFAVAACPS